jgi:phosphoserine phosphatase
MGSSFPWRLVTVDIDGTLTLTHGWREVAVAFGRLPAYERTHRRINANEVGEDEHLAELLDIATGHAVAEVEEVLARTPKLVGIAEGVARLHEEGAHAALLTHNPDYVVDWYRRAFGFDDAEGVKAQAVVSGRIGPPVNVRADKVGGMRSLLSRLDLPAARAVHVGDSWPDAEVFRIVGGGVALNSSSARVNAAADLAITTNDFRDVVDALARLAPRT